MWKVYRTLGIGSFGHVPSLFACLGEERPGSLAVEIPSDKHREEGTSVDEDALHRTFSWLSA
jgi:hypothetical protein